jgi:hypothetical protein
LIKCYLKKERSDETEKPGIRKDESQGLFFRINVSIGRGDLLINDFITFLSTSRLLNPSKKGG